MAYWEFLLQKEGDRDWLPLETAHVEISEGRYRIIAHTSYCEIPVEIRLSQLLTQQMPPRRKTLKRVGQTNASGLMVVIPFTHLTPGQWTVKCGAATQTAQPDWEYGVQLEVIAIESGVEYWDTDLDEEALVEQLAAEPLGDRTQTSERLSSSPSSPPANVAQVVDSTAIFEDAVKGTVPLEDLPLRLQLQHQALVAHSRAAVVLQGQVTSYSEVEGLAQEGTLWVQLRNPETGEVVHQETQALALAALPSRFELPLTLPDSISTRLLVGELSLWTASEPPQILAIQGFTVTLNLDALLELVANQAERSPDAVFEETIPPAATGPTKTSPAPSEEGSAAEPPPKVLAPLSPRDIPFRLIYLPSAGLTLPPVIYRPIDKKVVGAPSLPRLGQQQAQGRPEPADSPSSSAPAKSLSLPPIGSERQQPTAPLDPPTAPPSASPNVELPAFGRSQRSPTPPPEAVTETAPTAQPQPTEITFQPDFQGRFWHRLSALAAEAQKAAAEYKAQLEAAGVDAPSDPTATQLQDLQLPDVPADDLSDQNYEVVVYEPDLPESAPVIAELATEPLVEVLQPHDPDIEDLGLIPVPELVLPQGELLAGSPLPITIRMPEYPRRLAVKVWVTDVQSRALVDRPRWLMNWTPAADGEQTALLQLQVPLGSIEARFEAIAIDLATQRESYKTSQVRSILPANLSELETDDLV